MTEQAGTTGRYYCRGCGSQVRLGAQFCTECGLTAGPGRTAPDLVAAAGPDAQATTRKAAFVQVRNPLAQAYGLYTYSQGDL